jgi:DNA-binding transcriptional LysR family regulator
MLDLDDIRTFVAVADAGGLTPAARRLGVSKSIVSRRLVRLEGELGVQLLARTTRGAALTEAGATFRSHAARVTAEIEEAREAIAPTGDVQGLLRVTAPLGLGQTLMAQIIADLAVRHPRLHVHASFSDRVVDLVGEGFDAGVRAGYLADSSMVARRVAAIRGKLVASPAYLSRHGTPRTPQDLGAHECLMQGTEAWRLLDRGKLVVVHPQGRFKADNAEALALAAVAGLGIAALPDLIADPYVASGALAPILCEYPPPEAGLYVVRPPSDYVPRKVRVLIDMLIEKFA